MQFHIIVNALVILPSTSFFVYVDKDNDVLGGFHGSLIRKILHLYKYPNNLLPKYHFFSDNM